MTKLHKEGFKPCYKWITFNTEKYQQIQLLYMNKVLNLVINGLPSIPDTIQKRCSYMLEVLNLVINGLPSIQYGLDSNAISYICSFKPCYKWITFNTEIVKDFYNKQDTNSFKPCYKWITFNTI